MTKFNDGPASGQTMILTRAPYFLRVVQDTVTKKFDALDKTEDEPKPSETIWVYRREGGISWGHVSLAGKNGRRTGRFFQGAEYSLYKNPPDEATVRDTKAWRNWAQREGEAMNAEHSGTPPAET